MIGRLLRRQVFASAEVAALGGALSGWPGLRAALAVERIHSVNDAPEVKAELRRLLSSCSDSPAILDQAARVHWPVKNALHWLLSTISWDGLPSQREE